MNLEVQVKWWLIYATFGLAIGVVLGIITWIIVDIEYAPILVGLGTGLVTTYAFGKTIVIQEAHVPPGTVGIILLKGEVVEGDTLSPMKLPVVRKLYVPLLGTQEMYMLYPVPDKGRVSPDKIEVDKITTRDTKTTKGVDVFIELVVRKRIFDPVTWVENHISATVENDTRYVTNVRAVFTTAVKELIDHFTYDELDESSVSKEKGGKYEGKTFSEALVGIIRKGHGGITCEDCPDNPKYIRVPEWAVDITEILLESNLATSVEFKKAREEAAVSEVKRKAKAQDAQMALEVCERLQRGIDATGKKMFRGKGEENPFKGMPAADLTKIAQRLMGIIENPQEFILQTDGGGTGGSAPGDLLMQTFIAKVLSGDIKLL